MPAINIEDIFNTIENIFTILSPAKTHLIVLAVGIALAFLVMIACGGMKKNIRRLIRGEAWIAILLAVVIVANLICIGPLNPLLTSVAGKPISEIDDITAEEADNLVGEICREGIVLLKNNDNILPMGGAKVNVFGWSAINPCTGGTGSDSLHTGYPAVTFLNALRSAGIAYNAELIDFYTRYHDATLPNVSAETQDWTLPQPRAADYSDYLMGSAKSFSGLAVIFLSRVGGKSADLPTDMCAVVDGSWAEQGNGTACFCGTYDDTVNSGTDWDEGDHYLQLSNPEEEMVELVCQNFERVILIYNSSYPFELGFLEAYPQIKGAIQCAGTGQSGFTALARVLTGEVNPSGRLTDTFLYDLTTSPAWNNMGHHAYDNMNEFAMTSGSRTSGTGTNTVPTFVNYVEGIYVGYKFYETAAAEKLINYDKTVQYPFGYGLSYTPFLQTLDNVAYDGNCVNLTVTVTNIGATAGKDVVEVYFQPPYHNGGIEKASVNLLDFAKTELLQPGSSQTILFSIPVERMASYDDLDKGCYVLEAGDYKLSINSDSHTVLEEGNITVPDTIFYQETNKRDSDQTAAVNRFDYARGDATYLSRRDKFANYTQSIAAPLSNSMSAEAKATFYHASNYLTAAATAAQEDPAACSVTFGAKGEITLAELRGLSYDAPEWENLLNQLTLDEICHLIALGGHQTLALDSIGKYRTNDCDGPTFLDGHSTDQRSVGFPDAVMLASTWNRTLAERFGESVGKMADEMDTAGWYGPSMNIHRTAFAGRNFECYSEDGVLSGSIAASAIQGVQTHGVYAYMKRFALNDQESNCCAMLCTWCTEQAMREIYLKPFEMAVKEGGALAAMSSPNYIGNRWAGGSASLCETVLRDEWGFRGFVVADCFERCDYMSADQAVRNGTDLCLTNSLTATSQMQFRDTAGAHQAARRSAHRILYVTVNSRQYSERGIAQSTQPNRWETILKRVDIATAGLIALLEFLVIARSRKRKAKPR